MSTPTLENWQDEPFSSWGFTHASELVPTASIHRERQPSIQGDSSKLDDICVPFDGGEVSLDDFLMRSMTDALVVRLGNRVVYETYRGFMTPHTPHLLMSISKSFCGLIVGQLVTEGVLSLDTSAANYVDELTGSAFGEATLQQILDMSVSVVYSENYHDQGSHVQTQDRLAGWRLRIPGDPQNTFQFLAGLKASGAHGQRFQYCSAATDVLAWVIERVTGLRYANVLSERLWKPLAPEEDAQITVDREGFAFANGGISTTARDLTLLGRLMIDAGAVAKRQVVPAAWINETMNGGRPMLSRGTSFQRVHPDGSYHNQWWITGDDHGSIYAAGIYGQFLWVDPVADVVIAKFSSMPVATTEDWSRAHAEAFRSICRAYEG